MHQKVEETGETILFLSQRDCRLLCLYLAGSSASTSPHLLPDHHHLPYHHPSRRSRRPPPPPPPWPAPGAYGFVESSSSSSSSDLSLLNSHAHAHPDGGRTLRLRLAKAEVARLMHESTNAARKIMDLWVARNQHPSPPRPTALRPRPCGRQSAAHSRPCEVWPRGPDEREINLELISSRTGANSR
uniref:Uncharacterized protein n=1 Tax=Ananas comosus var. bracteatus TaxID=296719 RepID=A0A6V7PJM7_ANACO|nr:unnamed protein product [Ananas comosus var. bracteatus]